MQKLVPSEKSQLENKGSYRGIDQNLCQLFIFQNRKESFMCIIINIFYFVSHQQLLFLDCPISINKTTQNTHSQKPEYNIPIVIIVYIIYHKTVMTDISFKSLLLSIHHQTMIIDLFVRDVKHDRIGNLLYVTAFVLQCITALM